MCRVDTVPQRGTSRRLKRDAGSRTDVPERHRDVPERHTTAWYKKARIRSLVVPQRGTQPLVVHGACDLGTAVAIKRGKGAQRGERSAGGPAGSGGHRAQGALAQAKRPGAGSAGASQATGPRPKRARAPDHEKENTMARQTKTQKAIALEISAEMQDALAWAIEQWNLEILTDEMRYWNIRKPDCVRLYPDLDRYVRGLGQAPSGADTLDIADATADMLRGLDLPALYTVVSDELERLGKKNASRGFIKAFGKETPWEADNLHAFLQDRYADRNNGMQRMNLGNVLRAAQKRANGEKSEA